MSYLALARKWRPRTFSQLVGQDHINRTLKKSLEQQRVHHAYLFTGTRGVGKTSIARLLAKALNCEQGVSATPCLQCTACLSIEQGQFIDLIEIDGASRTRVEDTRELLENVQYAATSGRYKIYLIDEVHMLSQHSFNALLKTLEEPPAHVKFLLATTDPQKLPVTVLSRCLQFSLKPLTAEIIVSQMEKILKEEQYAYDLEALRLIACAAQGSMRDALSILDQAIASTDQHLQIDEVRLLLGHTQQDYAQQLLTALANLDAAKLIAISQSIAQEGGNFIYVLEQLLRHLHQISLIQALATTNHPVLTCPKELQLLADKLAKEEVQLFYQITLKGRHDIHLAPTLHMGFEMTMLRLLSFKPASPTSLPPAPNMLEPPCINSGAAISALSTLQPTAVPTMAASIPQPNKSLETNDWRAILRQLKLTGLALNAAENAELVKHSGKEVVLQVAKGHQSLFTVTIVKRIEEALLSYYQSPLKLMITYKESVEHSPAKQKIIEHEVNQKEAEQHLKEDPVLQQLMQEFSAEMVKNSIVSHKDQL